MRHPYVLLIVDDDPDELTILTLMLERAGYAVISAATADEALTLLAGSDVHLVVTDHLLPRMSGAELARRVKQEHASLPVLVISGLLDPPEGIAPEEFMCKVDGPEVLIQRIDSLLQQSEAVLAD